MACRASASSAALTTVMGPAASVIRARRAASTGGWMTSFMGHRGLWAFASQAPLQGPASGVSNARLGRPPGLGWMAWMFLQIEVEGNGFDPRGIVWRVPPQVLHTLPLKEGLLSFPDLTGRT